MNGKGDHFMCMYIFMYLFIQIYLLLGYKMMISLVHTEGSSLSNMRQYFGI